MINPKNTIISQYKNSPVINALVESFNTLVDPRADFEKFIKKIWNIRTAETWGLDNWGRILDISRYFQLDNGLEDNEQFRTLLYIRAAALISDCSVSDINRLLQWLFEGRGTLPYVIEVDTMYVRYLYPLPLEDWEVVLLRQEKVLPRPAGVGFEILNYDPDFTFGFYVDGVPDEEQPWRGFDTGAFADITYSY